MTRCASRAYWLENKELVSVGHRSECRRFPPTLVDYRD